MLYIAILVIAAAAGAPLLLSLGDRQRERALDRYARQVNLRLTDEVRPRVIRRILVQERATLIGGIGGALIGLGLAFVLPVHRSPSASGADMRALLALITAVLGAVVAPAITAVRATVGDRPGPRIARGSTPSLTDYVPTLERAASWIAPAGAALTIIGGWTALQTGVLRSDTLRPAGVLATLGAIFGYLAIASIMISRLLAGRVLQAGQPAGSEQELAWDDALRAGTLRALVQLPVAFGVASMLLTILEVGTRIDSPPDWASLVGGITLVTITVAGITALVIDQGARPGQHYWRRLWQHRSEPVAR